MFPDFLVMCLFSHYIARRLHSWWLPDLSWQLDIASYTRLNTIFNIKWTFPLLFLYALHALTHRCRPTNLRVDRWLALYLSEVEKLVIPLSRILSIVLHHNVCANLKQKETEFPGLQWIQSLKPQVSCGKIDSGFPSRSIPIFHSFGRVLSFEESLVGEILQINRLKAILIVGDEC